MKRINLLSATVSAALCSGLFAGGALAEYAETFESIDSDRNGYISPAEAQVRPDLAADFGAIDDNGDGQLNIDEFIAFESEGRYAPPEESEVPEIGAAPTE